MYILYVYVFLQLVIVVTIQQCDSNWDWTPVSPIISKHSHSALDKREENILCPYFFADKIIQ